jgi:carbon-monoxide dehydrogenase medium subunit
VKPAPFNLHLPRTVPEVLHLLGQADNARVIAGGQSLMPMLNMRLALPDDVIDLNGVDGLSHIRDEGDTIAIGAMTRQREIEFSDVVARRLPVMRAGVLNVGHRQTRNRGTLGGSLCHLDPSAELPTVCMLHDAELVIQREGQGDEGRRVVPMVDFGQGFMSTCVAPDELLTEVRIRPWGPGHGWHFIEFARRHGDFAVVSAAALIERDAAGAVARAALVLGGIDAAPVRLPAAEAILVGTRCEDEALHAAAAVAARCETLDDPAYPSWYRQRLAGRLLQTAIRGAWSRAAEASGRMQ